MSKAKTYKPHAKMYFRDDKEEQKIKETASKAGLKVSPWLRSLALREIQKEEHE